MVVTLPEKSLTILSEGIEGLGLSVSVWQLQQLTDYVVLLEKWNRTYNLTAIRDPEEMIIRHLLDSLSVSAYLSGKNIIDIGSGAGIPGIPLSVIFPDRRFTLLDSNGKKVRFMNQAKYSLKLDNVVVIQSRVESFQPEQFLDCIISRAFTSLKQIVEMSGHLINEAGLIQAMKGVYPEPQQQPLSENWKIERVIKLKVPGLDEHRHLVNIRRLKNHQN